MSDSLRSRNYLALGMLVLGKVLGIAGLAVGSTSRVLGGSLLVLDGIFIVAAVVVCLRTMKKRSEEDAGQKAVLRQMMKEGTLKQYLRDLEEEQRATKPAASDDTDETEETVPRQTALS